MIILLLQSKKAKVKNYYNFKIPCLLILFILNILSASAQQTGRIVGKVTDKKTGETLIGLTVKVAGTTKGVSTDVEGRYNIGGLTAGRYALVFSYVGYQAKKVSDIIVKAGAVTTMDVIMEEPGGQQLQQVVINISARQESIGSLYAQQKNSARISDGISAESIRKSPDRTTSDVLKRVSGTTIQDNKFVIVRGLSDRYNSALLDNSPLPSTEPNRKAFSFDVVPAGLIDNVIINKTATPDLPGDFAGGTVQIMTKDIPDQNFVTVSIGASYNTVSTFKDFRSGPRTLSDYLGFDDGRRQLADNFPSHNQVLNGLSAEQNINALKSLSQDWSVYKNQALPGQNYQFTIGRIKQYEKSGNRLGAVLSVTYRNSQQFNADLKRKFDVYDYNDDQYKFSTNLGAMANIAYSFGNSKITFKNLYNRVFDDMFTYRSGINGGSVSDNRYYAFDLLEKGLLKSNIEGEHKLGVKNSKLKWTIGFSEIINKQPDQRKINYSKNLADTNNTSIPYSADVTTLGKANSRFFSDLNEKIYSSEVSYSLPIKIFRQSGNFKAGVSGQYRDRTFAARYIGQILNPSAENFNEIRTRPLSQLFATDVISANSYRLEEFPNNTDNYDATVFVGAAYAMLDNKIGDNMRLVWGVRAEKSTINLETSDGSEKAKLDLLDILPSANFTYSLTPKTNIRASYYRTLARPELRELAPFPYYDYEQLANVTGNTNLKRALIDNADLRYEIYPSTGEIISVSVFYKRFTNAIESFGDDRSGGRLISYFNSKSANVYGAELEFRKKLDFISNVSFWKNSVFYTNLSLIKSKVKYDPNEADYNLLLEKERPLSGQSPYVINAGLQHSELNNKLSMNILYNRIGNRIFQVGGYRLRSVYENARDVFDAQVGYKVLKDKGEIKLNASDILNQNVLYFYDDADSKTYKDGNQILSRYKPGSTFSLSFNYTF